jgi:hypothetical protein
MNLCASVCPSRNQPHNHPSTNQPIIQPTINPINQSIPTNQPTIHSTNQPTIQSTNQAIMQSTIQETNKPVTTQTHLERLLQPAAAPAPCWACSRHVGPPCAAATRDLLGNSCCSWPSLPQLGASFGMDFASPGPAGLAQHVLRRNKLRGMNESWNWIEQNCLAHMKWSWTALKWMDRTKWDDLDWTKECMNER